MLVYVAHPYGGLEENKKKVEEIIPKLAKDELFNMMEEDITFVSPIHTFGHLYDQVDYVEGLNMCLDLLDKCEHIVVIEGFEKSKGCMAEYGFAKAKGKGIWLTNYEVSKIKLLNGD